MCMTNSKSVDNCSLMMAMTFVMINSTVMDFSDSKMNVACCINIGNKHNEKIHTSVTLWCRDQDSNLGSLGC